MRKHIRKVVSNVLIAAMLFFAPSLIPIEAVKAFPATTGCGLATGWLPTDTAFAGVNGARLVAPCPTGHAHTPVWPWVVIGCAGSIAVSALAAMAERATDSSRSMDVRLAVLVEPRRISAANSRPS